MKIKKAIGWAVAAIIAALAIYGVVYVAEVMQRVG